MNDNAATTLVVLGVLTVCITGTSLLVGAYAVRKINKEVKVIKTKSQKIATETKEFLRKLEDIL